MYKAMKVLAIIALLVTIAGAGLVLYGINTLTPVIEQVNVAVTPAVQAQDVFDGVLSQVRNGTFTGRLYGELDGLQAQGCTFVTYSVRLANKGFFPAEWISLIIRPLQGAAGYDVLQMDNSGGNVLAARSRGDIAATMLVAGDAGNTQRSFDIACYVLGQQIHLAGNTP